MSADLCPISCVPVFMAGTRLVPDWVLRLVGGGWTDFWTQGGHGGSLAAYTLRMDLLNLCQNSPDPPRTARNGPLRTCRCGYTCEEAEGPYRRLEDVLRANLHVA